MRKLDEEIKLKEEKWKRNERRNKKEEMGKTRK